MQLFLFLCFFLLHCSQTSPGYLLEYLETSGLRIITRGPTVCKFYVGRNRETKAKQTLEDIFHDEGVWKFRVQRLLSF